MATAVASRNPAFRDSVFDRVRSEDHSPVVMTLQGTVLKTFTLVAILLATGTFTWSQAVTALSSDGAVQVDGSVWVYVMLGTIGGLVLALVTIFVPRVSPWTAPVYAACEGLALGGISALFESMYQGIVLQAVGLTVGLLIIFLFLYGLRIIQATPRFTAGLMAAMSAICLIYLVDFVLMLLGKRMPFIHETGWVGIGFSLFVVAIASLNFILDFDLIERNVRAGAPRYMEWYCGFGLLLTLVWLYLEILELLAKLRSRE